MGKNVQRNFGFTQRAISGKEAFHAKAQRSKGAKAISCFTRRAQRSGGAANTFNETLHAIIKTAKADSSQLVSRKECNGAKAQKGTVSRGGRKEAAARRIAVSHKGLFHAERHFTQRRKGTKAQKGT